MQCRSLSATGEPATQPAASTIAQISAALDAAFRQHLNLMLRPHMAQRLRAVAASLPSTEVDRQPGATLSGGGNAAGRRPTFALPYLGESLMAAMDMTGRSPARSPGGALSGSLTRAGSAVPPGSARSSGFGARQGSFAVGSPDLIPFTGFDDGLEGADESLEDGLEDATTPTPLARQGVSSREPGTGFGQGLERFTAFDPGLPGANTALEDDASAALDGALEADTAAAHGEELQEDAVETADDWGIRPFGNFGAPKEDLSLEEMAAPAAHGTFLRHASHLLAALRVRWPAVLFQAQH